MDFASELARRIRSVSEMDATEKILCPLCSVPRVRPIPLRFKSSSASLKPSSFWRKIFILVFASLLLLSVSSMQKLSWLPRPTLPRN